MSDNRTLDCALDLMRRLPPQNLENNLSAVIDLVPPSLLQELLSSVDTSLKVATCKATNLEYLVCDYNRDGDSFRSPWSNTYDPPDPEGALPPDQLRKLEIKCNNAINQYRELYFEGGISSCYLWELDNKSFAGVVLIKKAEEGSDRIKGSWDSIHVFEVVPTKRDPEYKFTSTIMLWLETDKVSGKLNLGGSFFRQSVVSRPLKHFDDHVKNIGKSVEELENSMRQTTANIYFSKTKTILNSLRSMTSVADEDQRRKLQEEIAKKLSSKQ